MSTNTAAYLSAIGEPLTLKEAPYPQPSPNEVVVRNHAIALNPVDYSTQLLGTKLFPWLELPTILGSDVAGEVVAVGSEATSRFSVGGRIVGLADHGFQEYPTVRTHLASHLPSNVSYEQASVLPLALITASVGLFGKGYLELQHPSVNSKSTGKSLLICGGATSVGSCAIQIAVSAGYEVITTASPKNFAYVKKLGASYVFDYQSPTIRDDIISIFSGKASAGVFAISGVDAEGRASVTNACLDIVSKVGGVQFVSMAMPAPDKLPDGIGAKFIIAFDIKSDLELGNAIFRDYLPGALAAAKFTPAPPAEVIGEGLKAVQGGLDTLRKGVSAKKLVVTL
ncbi:chaperonin 10-like protein [Biscogniauxia sp. FL1348]|nr:chaperonin 10-like protein [Biscogniauxia sp. FL1348]